jgi:hypothetical protein
MGRATAGHAAAGFIFIAGGLIVALFSIYGHDAWWVDPMGTGIAIWLGNMAYHRVNL